MFENITESQFEDYYTDHKWIRQLHHKVKHIFCLKDRTNSDI